MHKFMMTPEKTFNFRLLSLADFSIQDDKDCPLFNLELPILYLELPILENDAPYDDPISNFGIAQEAW